jgi:acetyl-CoA carboxylase alpha subunit
LLGDYLSEALASVRNLGDDERVALRYSKFRAMGAFEERTSGYKQQAT